MPNINIENCDKNNNDKYNYGYIYKVKKFYEREELGGSEIQVFYKACCKENSDFFVKEFAEILKTNHTDLIEGECVKAIIENERTVKLVVVDIDELTDELYDVLATKIPEKFAYICCHSCGKKHRINKFRCKNCGLKLIQNIKK